MKPKQVDNRGITGIGTLIIFIALVLAAAIAAGVVLNTTGLLQSKATQTGEDSTAQVSNQLQILSVTGDVADDSNVTALNVRVYKSPGADNINMSEATIQYVGPNTDIMLNDTHYSVNALNDDDESLGDSVLNTQSDRAEYKIDMTTIADLNELQPGDKVTLRITTQSGSQTVYVISVPDTIYGGSQSTVEL